MQLGTKPLMKPDGRGRLPAQDLPHGGPSPWPSHASTVPLGVENLGNPAEAEARLTGLFSPELYHPVQNNRLTRTHPEGLATLTPAVEPRILSL